MIQIGVRSTGSRSSARRKLSFLSSVIAPFNYFVDWAAHERSPIFAETPGLLTRSPGDEFKSNAEVVEYPFRRVAGLGWKPIAMMTRSAGMISSEPGTTGGGRRPRAAGAPGAGGAAGTPAT